MEKLEITLKEVPVEKKEKTLMVEYEGLKLKDERVYAGGTSIKYWM